MTSRMPVLIAAVAGVLGGAIVGGSALIGASAASSPSTPEPATSGPSAHLHGDRPCGAGWAQLPDDLRAALKAARALPQGERRVAMEQIRKDAVAGKYGETAQKLAEKRSAHRQHRRDTCSPSPTQS